MGMRSWYYSCLIHLIIQLLSNCQMHCPHALMTLMGIKVENDSTSECWVLCRKTFRKTIVPTETPTVGLPQGIISETALWNTLGVFVIVPVPNVAPLWANFDKPVDRVKHVKQFSLKWNPWCNQPMNHAATFHRRASLALDAIRATCGTCHGLAKSMAIATSTWDAGHPSHFWTYSGQKWHHCITISKSNANWPYSSVEMHAEIRSPDILVTPSSIGVMHRDVKIGPSILFESQ